MGVALEPQRRHIYDPTVSASCPYCVGVVGTVKHVLMECPRFALPRSTLSHILQTQLRVAVPLSLELLLGLPSPAFNGLPKHLGKQLHERCLVLCGEFLLTVNATLKL